MTIFKKCTNYLRQKKRIPRFTFNGVRDHRSGSTMSGYVRRFDWLDTIVDALIVSALTFFITLSGDTVLGLDNLSALKAATLSACVQFFIILALRRGIGSKKVHH